ncbi:MAG: hypothetical protein V4581_05460 [Bacteroidota bacterium]
MHKKATLLLIAILSCIIAGAYGIINDYFLFKFCPEFFTEFKFVEYGVTDGVTNNAGDNPINIVKVGLMASWWMGLIIGSILGLLSLPIATPKDMYKTLFRSMGITVVITFLMSLAGLMFGRIFLTDYNIEAWGIFIPTENVLYPERFMMCLSMHNFSYIGAIIGMLVGSIFIIRTKRKFMGF